MTAANFAQHRGNLDGLTLQVIKTPMLLALL
jgi:hypothetical protein